MATGGSDTGARPETAVTWETYEEIGKPAGITVVPGSRLDSTDIVVCSPYRFGDPFILPGNRVSACSGCRGAIQHRPHVPAVARKLCMPCAVSEGLRVPVPAIRPGSLSGPAASAACMLRLPGPRPAPSRSRAAVASARPQSDDPCSG